ncbi:hypothetical protein L7F22_012671 [Adiantum nelumboides]|nr:hypothetical protein [Adiantum nelumboides]
MTTTTTTRRSLEAGAFLLLFVLFTAQALCTAVSAGNKLVGINYGVLNSTSLPPTKAVALIKSLGVGTVRLPDANPQVLSALARSGLDVVISIPDEGIPALAASESTAINWIQKNVIAFFPNTHITAINVGDNILGSRHQGSLWVQLLPAMTNLYNALLQHDLTNVVKVTTSFSMDVFSTTFPPASGTFREDIAQSLVAPILDFLAQTHTPLFLNVYPYQAWQKDRNHIPLSFALFHAPAIPTWLDNNLSYYNLLDAQLDAVAFAMEGLGYPDIDIVISETGWPTAGGVGASVTNAFKYNQGLVNKVIESPNVGTPHRPKRAVPAFLHALVDDGEDRLRWGLFNEDGSMAYPLHVWQSTEAGCAPAHSPARSPAKSPHERRVPAGDGDRDDLAPVPSLDEEDDGEDEPVSGDDDYAAPAPAPASVPVYDDSGSDYSPAPSPQSSPAAPTHPLLPRSILLIVLAALYCFA